MTDSIPLLVTILTIFGAAITYAIQKIADRKNELIIRRRQIYTDFLASLSKQISAPHQTNRMTLDMKRAEIFLLASDKVALAVGDFFRISKKVAKEESLQGSANDESKITFLESYAKMVLAMREDCFEKSNLNAKQAVAAMPIGYSEDNQKTMVQ